MFFPVHVDKILHNKLLSIPSILDKSQAAGQEILP